MLTCEAIWDPHILRRASVLRIGKHRPELSYNPRRLISSHLLPLLCLASPLGAPARRVLCVLTLRRVCDTEHQGIDLLACVAFCEEAEVFETPNTTLSVTYIWSPLCFGHRGACQ